MSPRRRITLAGRTAGALLLACTLSLPAADCDSNQVDDAEEIALGEALDCNDNGTPDHCEVEPVPYRVIRSLPVRSNATGLHLADLNRDGLLDLAVGMVDGVSVRLRQPGESDVLFAESSYFFAGRAETWAGGDLDGDGADDLVSHDGETVRFFYNDRAGAFPDSSPLLIGRGLEGIAIGDVNADGQPDIAIANRVSGTVVVLENQGDRAFAAPLNVPTTARPESVAVEDLDGDGDDDIICDGGNRALIVVRHEESLRFAPPLRLDVGGDAPRGLTATDFSGDGRLDLATITRSGIAVLVQGEGMEFTLRPYGMGGSASALGTGDFNGDGDVDVIASYRLPRGIFAFHNTGTGMLASGTAIDLALNLSPSLIRTADLDMDGDEDLLVIAQFTVSVAWNDSNQFAGDLVPLETVGDFVAGGPPHGGDIGDIDGDGDIDVIMGHNNAGSICISKNNGDGTFAPPHVAFPSIVSWTVTAVDLDQDGDVDVATTNRGEILLLRNPGNGMVEPDGRIARGASAYHLTHGDVDADGDNDLISATGGNLVSVYLNTGTGAFPERTSVRTGSNTRGVSPFDMDADGDVDLAASNFGSSGITFLTGDGTGNFDDTLTLPVLGQPNFVVTDDLDGDGLPDAVTANRWNGSVSVFWSRGGGQFEAGINLDVERELYSMWTGDLTGDGLPELVTVTEAGRTVSVLVNSGSRAFSIPVRYLVGSGPRHVRVAHLDGDDNLDVVSINRGGSSFTVLRNVPNTDPGVGSLPRVCTFGDFFSVSQATTEEFERETSYLLPARADALLAAAVLNIGRFPLQQDFLAAELPERFPAPPDGEAYQQLVGRRATREYFAGTITRRRDEGGSFYTFTIATDGTDLTEVLSVDEVAAVHEDLSRLFTLEPLAFEPDTTAARDAAESWADPPFRVFLPMGLDGGELPTPKFALEVPEGTTICGVFPKNAPGRSPREEYEAKATLQLRGGTMELPTERPAFEASLFDELIFGPERLVARPTGPGTFRLVELAAGEEKVHRFTYRQEFELPGGTAFAVQVFGLDYRSRAGIPVGATRTLDESFLTFGGSVEGLLNGDPVVSFSSCEYPLLPGFEIEITAADETRLRLREQFLEVQSKLDTGPAALIGAEVTLDGVTLATDDYWQLVYAARRHNQDVHYWVVLEPPAAMANLPRPVRVVEVLSPQPDERPDPLLNYLDENLQPQGTSRITSFEKRPAATARPDFRRGDVDASGRVNVADAVLLLQFLFQNGEAPPCLKAGDSDDSGSLNLVDAIRLLLSITQGQPLAAPLQCGADPTEDLLPCDASC